MDIRIQKNLYRTDDKKLLNNRSFKLFGMMIISILIILLQIVIQSNVFAASGIRIYNYTTKKEYTYTDTQVKVTYDGKKISIDSTPGLLENGIALVPYKDIFAKSPVKADCVYDKSAGTVSIAKDGITIVLKLGSKTAYINGKAVTAPLAPVKIKFVNEDVTKILVPSRFVFENLGYKYTWDKNTSTVSVDKKQEPIVLSYDDGDRFNYTGTLGKVTIDGENIDLGKMPSIITNNTAMLRAKRVFADTKINADYKYNSQDQSITLSRNGIVLKMKVGSPVAYLNDRAIVLDTAPMIVTNHNAGASYVLVPGSFTASCLGFDYRWDKNTMTSILTSRDDEEIENVITQPGNNIDDHNTDQTQGNSTDQTQSNTPGQTQDNAPELGDSAVKWDRGTIIQQWEGNSSLGGESSGIHSINGDDNVKTPGSIYSVTRDYSNYKLNAETYSIVSNNPFSTVTSKVIGRQIRVYISNMTITENTYYFGINSGGITDNIRTYNGENFSSILEFNLISDEFTYDLSLSNDKRILNITLYQNYLEKATIGTNDTMDYITLTGKMPLNAVINKIPGLIYIELPRTKKIMDDMYANLFNTKCITYANIFYNADSTHIYLGLNDNYEFYVVEEGNDYTIMIPAKDKPFTPVVPSKPDEAVGPETPAVTDNPIANKDGYELIIPNPAGLSVNQIKDEDLYSKLRFAIRIPGDYTSYLQSNPIKINSNVIDDVSIFLNADGETEILVSTSVLQGYEIFADADYIYVNIGNPRDIYKNIVVLDPGHGGTAPGAMYGGVKEKDMNLKILYEIGKDFFNSDPSKLKVYYTRESDVDVSLADRAAFANKIGADLFVSLHMNANTNKTVYGTEVYYSDNNNKKNKAGLNSETLAKLFVNNVSGSVNTKNRGTRAARYTVVHNNTVPAVLIELAFMSNSNDLAKITDSTFQYKAAKTIYETLLQVFELYPTGR